MFVPKELSVVEKIMQKLMIKLWAWLTDTKPVEIIEIDGKISIAFAIKNKYVNFNGKPVVLKENGGVIQDFPLTVRAWRYYE